MISIKRGFTLIELMVVIAMIAMIIGALATSYTSAQERSRVEKARSEVKAISQAILAYENFNRDTGELPTMTDREADSGSIGFLIGNGGNAESGGKIPALLLAALQSGGKMRDPWGTPYRITIRPGGAAIKMESASGAMQTGYMLPNLYRLSEEERQ